MKSVFIRGEKHDALVTSLRSIPIQTGRLTQPRALRRGFYWLLDVFNFRPAGLPAILAIRQSR